jgi:hypothetical protein
MNNTVKILLLAAAAGIIIYIIFKKFAPAKKSEISAISSKTAEAPTMTVSKNPQKAVSNE